MLQSGEGSEGNLVPAVTPDPFRGRESVGERSELDEHDPWRLAEGGKPACGSGAHDGAGADAPCELDGHGGQHQGMTAAALEDPVEHQVLGVVVIGGLHPDVVTQRVRDAAGLTLSVYPREAEEVAAEVIQALQRRPRVDRPKLRCLPRAG